MATAILMYHSVSVAPRPGKLRSLCVSPVKFSRQMRALKMFGYRGVSMREAMPYLRGEQTGKVVAITFDDGYRDNLTAALPVLKANGFTATCYVVSGLLGQENTWDPPGIARKPLMAADDVRAWHAGGMEVGAHSATHVKLTQGGVDEIAQSKRALESLVQAEVSQFCYPYGDVNRHVRDSVERAGFAAATTIENRHASASDDPFLLPRVFIGGPLVLPVFFNRVRAR